MIWRGFYRKASCFTWVACGVLFLSLGSCVSRVPSPSVAPIPVPTPEEVLATLHAREANITSLKGLFQADVQGQSSLFSRRIQGVLIYQRPGSIRIKGFTRFGGTVFDFLLHGQSYALYMPERQDPVVGYVWDDFRRLGPLRVPVRLSLRAADILLGKIQWTADQFREVQIEETSYRYIVPLSFEDARNDSSGTLQHVWVNRYSAQIQTIEYRTPEEETLATLTASDFRRVRDGSHQQSGSTMLPFFVEVEDHVAQGSVQFEFLELAVNVAISRNEFELR